MTNQIHWLQSLRNTLKQEPRLDIDEVGVYDPIIKLSNKVCVSENSPWFKWRFIKYTILGDWFPQRKLSDCEFNDFLEDLEHGKVYVLTTGDKQGWVLSQKTNALLGILSLEDIMKLAMEPAFTRRDIAAKYFNRPAANLDDENANDDGTLCAIALRDYHKYLVERGFLVVKLPEKMMFDNITDLLYIIKTTTIERP